MQKPCPRCHAAKPPAAFYRDATRADGLSYYCRECVRAIKRGAAAGSGGEAAPEKGGAARHAQELAHIVSL